MKTSICLNLFVQCLVEYEYNKYNYSSSSSQEMSASDFAETAIYAYQLGNLSQFSDSGNHLAIIKSGFTSYLKDELGLSDVTVSGNKIVILLKKRGIYEYKKN